MFTSFKVDQIRAEMTAALALVESSHNLDITIGKITYSNYSFNAKLSVAMGVDGEAPNVEKQNWDRYCDQYGFKKSDLGRIFTTRKGERHRIVGIAPRRSKYPISTQECHSGGSFKFPHELVIKLLAMTAT